MRILVIGAGAVGGYFGARLAAAGRDVTFLVRGARAEQLRRTGLNVTSPNGNASVPASDLKLLAAHEIAAPFDLILVSTKAYSLEAAMEDFAPAVGPQTMILPLLNGMAHLDKLVARFGEVPLLGGSTRIVADVDAEGTVHSMEQLHDLNFGERNKAVTPRIQAVDALLGDAGFEAVLQPDILATMWQKWTFLSSLGAITCLMRGTIGQVASTPAGDATARGILTEAAAAAAANGYPVPRPFLEAVTARLLKKDSTLTASMYRDLQKGAPVEADQILGDLLRRAAMHSVPAPLLTAAYAQLCVYRNNRGQ
jgi:2-dehydropantoate 2-reductase